MLEEFQVNHYQFDSLTELNDNLQYLDYINQHYEFQTVNVQPDVAYRYQGNLFGLLRELKVKPPLFVYTMYLNGYTNPREYDGNETQFTLAIRPPIPSN